MASVNRVILVGHLGRDPEARVASETTVCNFSVATTETWKDKAGDRQERTEWNRCVAWGKLGDICAEYLRKGAMVYIEGRLQTREWEDKEGVKRYTTEINVERMQMLDKRKDQDRGDDDGGRDRGRDSGRARSNSGRTEGRDSGSRDSGSRRSSRFDDLEDDIPF